MLHRKTIFGDLLTPVSTFLHVASESDHAFLLESVEGGERIGRYSFIGTVPERCFQGGFEEFRRIHRTYAFDDREMPPFCGGAVGFFSYDLIREFENLPEIPKSVPDLLPGPPVRMDFYSTVLVFDHLKHEISILSHEGPEKVQEMEDRLVRAQRSFSDDLRRWRLDAPTEPSRLQPQGALSSESFQEAVHTAQRHIKEGDIFQAVLSQRFSLDFGGDPFDVYRALRYLNPSPYHFFLKQGDLSIVGASPEMLVKLRGRHLECRPIAGTRRRGRDPQHDRHLEKELLGDEKERAEHLMLVDLGRNDLGRVSRYGSVQVEEFMRIERYSHVMHIVSSVSGELQPSLDAFDAFKACFPAGTVSGAPKVRAMEIIDRLEPWRRGVYAGAIGYLDYRGNLDSCIAIRTLVFRDGKAFVQAGAGIVADSIPAHEELECRNKAQVLFQALEMGAAASISRDKTRGGPF